ncbi:hypothetical protein P7C70_g2817, partial [Phenoliferia sp. Uapishka_3]
MLPTPSPSRPASAAGHNQSATRPVAWMPSRLHPDSIKLAHSHFDVITPADPRAPIWPDLADVVILRTGRVTVEELRRCKRLKVITRNGVGVDSIPLDVCRELGIRVTNQPGSNAKSVAELVLGMALAVSRRIVELDRRMRRGEHLPNIDWMAASLDGRTIGLVGMGAIAREVAKKFVGALEAPVLVYSPTSSPNKWTSSCESGLPPIPHIRVDSLEAILQQADVVSLHCPLLESNKNMISTGAFATMKPTAILLNSARGGLVDEVALVKALRDNVIAGAGLDVLCHEPASREIYSDLYDLENVVVLPHA